MANNPAELIAQAKSIPLIDHARRLPGREHPTVCVYSNKEPPQQVTIQLLAENKGVHQIALTQCVCGKIFRFYPGKGRGLKGEWHTTSIEIR